MIAVACGMYKNSMITSASEAITYLADKINSITQLFSLYKKSKQIIICGRVDLAWRGKARAVRYTAVKVKR